MQIYTWLDATLKELTSLVKEVNPDSRKKGTFFDFAIVSPSRRNVGMDYSSRDIGTTVSGTKGTQFKYLFKLDTGCFKFLVIFENPISLLLD